MAPVPSPTEGIISLSRGHLCLFASQIPRGPSRAGSRLSGLGTQWSVQGLVQSQGREGKGDLSQTIVLFAMPAGPSGSRAGSPAS